jgi:Rps23 Pro-64 3,4-dihydroxylase Tpa1-like proline 4-hydroxylase
MSSVTDRPISRTIYADRIADVLTSNLAALRAEFRQPGRVQSCHIDNLLPEDLALEIYGAFPKPSEMMERKSLREHKYVAAQMNKYNPILEEAIFAFQDARVLALVEQITGIKQMIPDEFLYAGGISLMGKGHFLNPHLDNSHDKERETYRVLNLLYYVSPDWSTDCGGNLELWDHGPTGSPREIESKFNRLVLMATHKESWHSVNQVRTSRLPRCCVSNYYFSRTPLENDEYFHITTFRGRPEEPVKDILLQGDAVLRSGLRKIFKKGVAKTKHVYKKDPG